MCVFRSCVRPRELRRYTARANESLSLAKGKPMIVFDANDDFASEKFENYMARKTGFCLNIKGPTELVLHKLPCHHFVFHTNVNLAANGKRCSPDRQELVDWARKQTGATLKLCSTCAP